MKRDQQSASNLDTFRSPPRPAIETLVRVGTYLGRHKAGLVISMLCMLLSLGSALAFPQLTQYIIDGVLNRQEGNRLAPAIVALLAAFLLRDLFGALHTLLSNDLEQAVTYDMRRRVYEDLQHLPIRYFDKMSSGDLMTRVVDDVTDAGRLLVEGTEQAVISTATVVVVLVILFTKDAYLATFSLVPLPVVVLASTWFTVVAHERVRERRRSLSQLSAMLLDNLQGIRQIKAFCQARYASERFDRYAEQFRRSSMRVLGLWGIYIPTMAFLTSLGTVLVWAIGGALVLDRALTLGELISFIFYLSMLYTPIINLHGLNSLVQSARAASERLFQVLDEESERSGWPGPARLRQPVLGAVRYDSVGFEYEKGRPVLRNLSLHVPRSRKIAVVGASGAGKSTFASLLLGFYPPTCGRILIDDQDIRKVSLESLRQHVGLVSQEPFLFNGTVRENILYGRLEATEDDVIAAARAANCEAFIRGLPQAYDTVVGEHGVRLSGGQRQRICIARAILKNAPILILDDATAALDSASERIVLEALAGGAVTSTVFIIAHRLSTVRHADQIVVLQDGCIVEQGTHETLIVQNGPYARMCAEQELARH